MTMRMARCVVICFFAAFSCAMATSSETCHKIPANRVWDVQWSGSPSATAENFTSFRTPYTAGQRLQVEADDYFTLAGKPDNKYQLQQLRANGTIKTTFAEGEVKANSEAAFYIVNGFYGTLITKEAHQYGDSASLSNLALRAPGALVQEALGPSCLLEGGSTSGPEVSAACTTVAFISLVAVIKTLLSGM